MFAKHHLLVIFGQNLPKQQSHGLFATAKLLVDITVINIVDAKMSSLQKTAQRVTRDVSRYGTLMYDNYTVT